MNNGSIIASVFKKVWKFFSLQRPASDSKHANRIYVFLGTNGVDNGIFLIALMEVLISEYNLLYWNTLLIYCAELT